MKLIVATRSRHKLTEIRRILDDVPGVELVGLDDVPVPYDPAEEALEPHDTFEANALSKARWFRARSGLPTVSDDSGLEVDALAGAPGVRTKRFAPVAEDTPDDARDRANNAHLLELLDGVPEGGRGARYVCVVALAAESGEELTFRGEAPGVLATEPAGEGGFGYDPLFFDPACGRTFAEITAAEKDARSHRGTAFRKLAEHLRSRGGAG